MENIKLDEFIQYKFLANIQYAPDGRHACFVLHKADMENNHYKSNLWLYSVETEKSFQLTAFDKETNYLWLADSRHILFSGIRNPKDKEKKDAGEEFTQFYRISIHGGEAQEAFRVPRNVSAMKEICDGVYIFKSTYNGNRKDLEGLEESALKEALTQKKEERDYEVLDEIPFWANGAGFINKNRTRLYLYDVNAGSGQALTAPELDVEEYSLNGDKTKIIFTAMKYEGKMEIENALYLYDLNTKVTEQITPSEKFIYDNPHFMGEDTIICTGKNMERYGLNENSQFYLVNLQTRERVCITPTLDCALHNSVGSDCRYGTQGGMVRDGEYLYFITTENESAHLNRINKTGKLERLTAQKGTVDDFTVNNGKILWIGFREMKLQELYVLDGGQEKQLTEFNEWLQKERKVVKPERVSFESAPGVQIDGWVLRPTDFDESKKYPGILDIHGGPKTVYGETFYHEMQYWASEGYVVFYCNPRGSDGKGDEFADIRGKYGTIDYDDIMKFTDLVLEKCPFIDPERIGVTGGSYGGFMTNWIIGHTHRFKAAASQRSISNWISKFCTTDIGYYFNQDQIGANPWDDQEKLWWHSPLKYANRVKTPTLIIHSEEDYRCWLAEGIQMFTALKYHGVEARLCMFRGENHELTRSGKPKHRIRSLKEITEWFNKYLK